ncbi:cytokinesis regulator protein [Niveomyces insectorum RCEF 264]|uniref:Cytokinesis regulator protein n=1 Tax=Niveomyces insectorum RCEF 264 TaxID=1081102 RepID=A0A162J6G3_9HYPO|nr:cytokinesis regulator protein [Niveomyces insectorum RCEF 264]
METLRLKPRKPLEDVVENWDDDDFMIEGDDITFRSSSTTAHNATTTTATTTTSRRDSHSSFRSDFESVHAEEEQQVVLPGDDENSTRDAIALAANAGIPLPKNVPPSALMGGTIKRLGGRKIRKIFQEDWGDDLEFPDDPQPLHIKPQDGSKFPDVLRQVSGGSTQTSPVKSSKPGPTLIRPGPPVSARTSDVSPGAANLERFRDADDDDDDFFGDGGATIKAPKTRQAPKPIIPLITPPTPQKNDAVDDGFEQDLELPSDGKLMLSKRKEIPKTPSLNMLDDFEWGEGSLGTRFGGTRRDGRSNRSSSASALSPSVSSSITAESEGEDDTFDGLVLPSGPVNFGERLQRRRHSRSPQRSVPAGEPPTSGQALQPHQQQQQHHLQHHQCHSQAPQPSSSASAAASALGVYSARLLQQQQQQHQQAEADREDFLTGLDLGDGDVFDTSRPTLHRNVRLKEARPASPSRPKAAVSLTFTNKPASGVSRLPRPLISHERTHTASSLEPVSESGGPIYNVARRSQSRIGHSAQSSVSSIPTPSTPSSVQSMPPPSTPRRRELGQKSSTISLRNEPTTTNAQLLRLKRSLPVMRQGPSPAPRPPTSRTGYERPPSRTDLNTRPQSAMRPKTPVERTRPSVESAAAQARKNPLPFLPAGASQAQSHHVTAKSSRVFRRHDSDTAVDIRSNSRAVSRSTMRSPSPSKKYRSNVDKLAQEGSWQQLSKPRRQRQFGDGHELDGFDDLPTSVQTESRYLRQPVAGSSKPQMRSKVYQNILPDRTNTPSPLGLYTPAAAARFDNLPRFARDTAASRIARETSLAQRAPSGPLAPLTTQRVAQLSTRNNYSAPHVPRDTVRSKKTPRRPPQLKPYLISNLNGTKDSKTVNGMLYNPDTMRWEGNENALSAFDPPASSPSTASIPPYLLREKENATPRPALITPIGATKGVQVVGGMVFDPQNMCWLKLGPQNATKNETADSLDDFNGFDSDEDVFKDIPDLDDMADTTEVGGGRVSEVKDDWLVGEEFDVGPEFVRRQREEEQRWRKKCERWMVFEDRDQNAWRWLLQDMVTHPI